jgi:hypothetical protein
MFEDDDREEERLVREINELDHNVFPGEFKVRDGFLIAFCVVLVSLTVLALFNING